MLSSSKGTATGWGFFTLGIFSGFPDPTWVLEREQTAVLKEILASLQPTDRPQESWTQWPPYSGFVVLGGDILGSSAALEVYDGMVMILDSNYQESIWLADPDHRVEKYLFETAKAHVKASTYQEAIDRFHKVIR